MGRRIIKIRRQRHLTEEHKVKIREALKKYWAKRGK